MRDVARRVFDEALFEDCNIVLFEDERTSIDLFPMSVLRPSWEIRAGAGCTRLWFSNLPKLVSPVILRPRRGMRAIAVHLAGHPDESYDSRLDTVFVNGRVVALWKDQEIPSDLPETIIDNSGTVLMARQEGSKAEKLLNLEGNEIARALVQDRGTLARDITGWKLVYSKYVWDYMRHTPLVLGRQLHSDKRGVPELMGAHVMRETPVGVQVTDRAAGFPVYLGPGAKLHPSVVFGNHKGAVWIGSGTEIEPHTYIEGPIFVGAHCRIKAGARLYPGSAIGEQCRVAGEVSQSVFQGFVNKQHDGFIGNSILGQWVNLGADTRTSNLRNDYGEVKVKVGKDLIRTGERHIGLMAGDHVKTGINTMFNTATVVGVGANVYGAGYPTHFIGSFMWGGSDGLKPGSLERTLETARIVMNRRGQELTNVEVDLLRKHYAETINEETRA